MPLLVKGGEYLVYVIASVLTFSSQVKSQSLKNQEKRQIFRTSVAQVCSRVFTLYDVSFKVPILTRKL